MLVGTPSCRPRAFHSESGTPGNRLWGCSDTPGLSAIHVMVAGSVRAAAFSPFCAQEASIARHAAQVSKIFFMVFVVWICMRRMGGGCKGRLNVRPRPQPMWQSYRLFSFRHSSRVSSYSILVWMTRNVVTHPLYSSSLLPGKHFFGPQRGGREWLKAASSKEYLMI